MDKSTEVVAREAAMVRKDQIIATKKKHNRDEGMTSSVSQDVFMAALKHEGKHITTKEGREWWDDQERIYPHLNLSDKMRKEHKGSSANGTKIRQGKVNERYRDGEWWHWCAEVRDWVRGEITPRKGFR